MAFGSVPGFFVQGAEVNRIVAIEPLPEPTLGLMLGVGVMALAGLYHFRR